MVQQLVKTSMKKVPVTTVVQGRKL